MLTMVKNKMISFWEEEDGLGTLEMILIIGVIIVIGLIFKNEITSIVNKLLNQVGTKSDEFFK
ncbi:Flp1 family type IVb pilin [Paenibacillus sp. Marseille-Q4541]|uniref:Flp1 family type IVb pilin n=1 Tax=Paenibacillus sp. Marseille-Q4541 TaxID=2831522 RepID=UPI001BAA4169|nr:Flp1 family type IVb pilin [Paenibacillus sp. Marseille-Q4541]